MPLHKSLFIESNPSPVKYAASLLNLSSDEVRLPLVKITEKTKKGSRKSFKDCKSALMKAKKIPVLKLFATIEKLDLIIFFKN